MAMSSKQKTILTVVIWLIALFYPAGWLISEVRWSYVNRPDGRFSNAAEYLAQSRQPSRVTKVTRDNKTYFIAYGPRDMWLAVPSGTAAYIFDAAGQMIEWSADTGDDETFEKNWPLSQQEESSAEELRRLADIQPARGVKATVVNTIWL